MRTRNPVSDEIIERVALIWSRAIKAPKFDNGDRTGATALAGPMAARLARNVTSAEDYPAKVEAFRLALIANLKSERDHDGEPHPEPRYEGHLRALRPSTGCDYGPDATLAEAAAIADLDTAVFPWKSTVDFYDGTSVSTSFGYGAPDENHYPLGDGRWLITSVQLRGPDRDVILRAVRDGRLPDLTVEETPASPKRETAPSLAIVNRYVDLDGATYRVCNVANGQGEPGRLLLIIRRDHTGGDTGPALKPGGVRHKAVLKALAEAEAAS